VLADATRRITRNRQPGRCCAAGCQMTELPAAATAPLPAPPGCARPAVTAPAEPHTSPGRSPMRTHRDDSLLLVIDIQGRLAPHVAGHDS